MRREGWEEKNDEGRKRWKEEEGDVRKDDGTERKKMERRRKR